MILRRWSKSPSLPRSWLPSPASSEFDGFADCIIIKSLHNHRPHGDFVHLVSTHGSVQLVFRLSRRHAAGFLAPWGIRTCSTLVEIVVSPERRELLRDRYVDELVKCHAFQFGQLSCLF